jgi:undecaprenyl diphosphate synthase
LGKFEKVLALPPERIPEHVAIILDGNGRWAERSHRLRAQGHHAGADNVETITYACMDMGIRYLTVYAFSTENWKRSKDEVSYLMLLLKQYLLKYKKTAIAKKIRVRVIGDLSGLSEDLRELVLDVEEATKDLTAFNLTFAINYGGRDELVRAVRSLVHGGVPEEEITENRISGTLDTAELPDPDLLIRTGGELRISNFLLWQCAYSEFYFTDILWPDFGEPDLEKAILDYAGRERRFGGRKK